MRTIIEEEIRSASKEFAEFYEEIHGFEPFPWQVDLVERVLTDCSWPELIDVPTGMGKTSLLDIAVFISSKTLSQSGSDRLVRRRIFFVVDRRIIVDEAYGCALRLSEALDKAYSSRKDSALRRVAIGLAKLAPYAGNPLSISTQSQISPPPSKVLQVTRMRGGVTWDAAWLDRPDLAALVIGTIDQIGSRIFFRGYGVSQRRASIDAALVGIDSLIFVDEAHLAGAMVSTLNDAHSRDTGGVGLPRAEVVQLTATSSSQMASRYSIDIVAHENNETAWKRLNAAKCLSLVSTDKEKIVADMAGYALNLITPGHDAVLVVCNTVDRARDVYATINKCLEGRECKVEVTLLIGRSRPSDRETLVSKIQERFGVGRQRKKDATPAILVATQTVEVGANLDFDGLVTESAPWDSLVQRLGRLNRLGKCSKEAQAFVAHDGVKGGPVYGEARDKTWEFLNKCVKNVGGNLPVSPLQCRELTPDVDSGVYAPRPVTPLLTIPVLDSWVRTGPVPYPDTPVAPYLHGLGRKFATVSIAWRDGLLSPSNGGAEAELNSETINSYLEAVPIRTEELVEVPLYSAVKWMRGESVFALSDLDEDPADLNDSDKVDTRSSSFGALVWRSQPDGIMREAKYSARLTGSWVWVDDKTVRAGDILVVPVERGGLDEYGWAPQSKTPVLDISEVISQPDLAQQSYFRKWRPFLRIDAKIPTRLGLDEEYIDGFRDLLSKLGETSDGDGGASIARELAEILISAIESLLCSPNEHGEEVRMPNTAWTPNTLLALKSWLGGHVKVVPIAPDETMLSMRFILTPSDSAAWEVERDDEFPECSSISSRQVTLAVHHVNVSNRARDIAISLGLSSELVAAVETAGYWHDLGKVDSRFQVMLCGGSEYEAMLVDEPLAKSGIDPADRNAYRIARQRSGLPQGARHEAWSAGLVREYLNNPGSQSCFDRDLVIHLVASHHGHARPWLPPIRDRDDRKLDAILKCPNGVDQPMKVSINTAATVDLDHPKRFAVLNEKYGRWGLALLESIVRCADMSVSKEGS